MGVAAMKKVGFSAILICLFILMQASLAAAAGENLTVHAYRDDLTDASWTVMMRFNHPVFPSNVAGATAVTTDKGQEEFDLLDPATKKPTTSAVRSLLLVPKKAHKQPVQITITVEKGLGDSSGRRLLEKNFTYQFLSVGTVYISGLTSFFKSASEKGVNFYTSESVPEEELLRAIQITPKVPNMRITRRGGSSYQVTGDFEFNREYTLKASSVPVNRGQAVLEAKEFEFKGPGIAPDISIKSERSIIELRGRQLLALQLANVDKVRCGLTRIPAFLVPDAMEAEINVQAKVAELKKAGARINPVFLAEPVKDSDAFFAPQGKNHSYGYSVPLSFRKNPEHGGAWQASFTDADDNFKGSASRLIQITDLSISYKLSGRNLLLWVTSLYTGLPTAGVEVLLSHADGNKYFVGKTEENGCLMITDGQTFPAVDPAGKAAKRPLDLPGVKWAVAANATDSCALELDTFRLKSFSVTPEKTAKNGVDSYTGYAFTERGVYRPGETVHFKFLARAYKNNKIVSPARQKVKVEIVNPRSETVYSKEFSLGDFGSCYDTFDVKKFYPVGTYTLNAFVSRPGDQKNSSVSKESAQEAEAPPPPAEDAEEAEEGQNGAPPKPEGKKDSFSTTFMVQEFKKIRHFATLSLKRERVAGAFVGVKQDEDFVVAEIAGQYYTGGPVKHGRVRWKATLVPVANKVPGYGAYFFGNEDDTTQFLESGEALLDGEGKLRLTVPLDPRLLTGIYGVNISATVLDIDGEPATEVETYNPAPQTLVGISIHPKQVQSGYAAPLKLVVVDKEGKRIPSGSVQAQIMRKEWFYVQKRDEEGNLSDTWQEGWVNALSSQVSFTNGEGVFQCEFTRGGDYMLVFTYSDEKGKYSSQTLFKVGWEAYENWAREKKETGPRTSREILLSMNKKDYRVGEPVKVEFNIPRPVKKCLVTLEKGEILDYRVVDVNGTNGTYQFTTTADFQPNVYISVLGAAGRDGFPVYASQVDTDIPMIYFGYANIAVKNEAKNLKVEIDPSTSDLKGRPGEKKSLTFRVTDHAGKGVVSEMAVCVVDEAILALTRFQTPGLASLANFTLPLAVFSGDLRLGLVSQDLFRILTTKPLTGGGVGTGEVSPSLRKDFRPVAYFSPALLTDASGTASVEFKLPDTTTAYRVYAVVCDKSAGFASGQRNMVVTKEFFIEPSLTRFLVPGDKAILPIVLNNKTAEKGNVSLQAEASKELKLNLLQNSATLEPWSTFAVKGSAEALGGTEKAVLRFTGKFSSEKAQYSDAIQLDLPMHSRFLPVNRMQIGDFTGKAEIQAKLPDQLKKLDADDLNAADFTAGLGLSTNNWTKLAPGLKYLLQFPYGCIEQTSSGVIPLAGIRGLVKAGQVPGIAIQDVDKFLKGGVDRLLSMQVNAGGFSYWPGSLEVSWWGTMYATFAIMSAKEAGFDVPQQNLDKALKFLRDKLFDKQEFDKYHGAAWTREMALFNLAYGNMLEPQDLQQFMTSYDSVSDQAKAFMILAAKKIKFLPDAKLAEMINKIEPKIDVHHYNYSDSSYRQLAACLMAAVETHANPEKANTWAGELIRGVKPDGRWYSTADTGWCLLALSRYYQSRHPSKPHKVTVRVDYGEGQQEISLSDAAVYVELDALKLLKTGKITLHSDSKELVTYTLDLKYPDIVTDPAQLRGGFTLSKKMENLNGKDEIRVGDVVRVTLEMDLRDPSIKYDYGDLEYLALVDPVPAGMVPINSELKTEGVEAEGKKKRDSYNGDWVADFTPSYFEFRDDGVRVFKNKAWISRYKYSYLARAVAEGEFWMRGSRISLMYEPEKFGKTAGKKVTILPFVK